jgi:hypothetical protein
VGAQPADEGARDGVHYVTIQLEWYRSKCWGPLPGILAIDDDGARSWASLGLIDWYRRIASRERTAAMAWWLEQADLIGL